jgi:hypothetical protein
MTGITVNWLRIRIHLFEIDQYPEISIFIVLLLTHIIGVVVEVLGLLQFSKIV